MERRMGRSATNMKNDRNIAGLYDMERTLGSGHFAVVKLARHVFTGEKVAVKVIDKTKLDEKAKAHLYQEVRCMKLVQHPNVVRLYEVIDTQTKLYLILEFGDGGDMYDYIMKHEGHGISEDKAKQYFHQIVSAIDYCHKLHVVHRDLKPENVIFFKNQDQAKLTDFGFSNSFLPGEKLYTSCGSLAYSAPEILLGDSYDAPAVDVWSLGVILYMMVCGSGPFSHANDSETLTMIMDCKYEMPEHLSTECKNLINKMLVREPHQRASLDSIAADPWLHGCSLKTPPTPLISELNVTPTMHLSVVQKMEAGTIASRDEINRSLESNTYDHVTATYFLLSERLMRKKYGNGPPLHTKLSARHSSPINDKSITDENRNTQVVSSNDILAIKSPLASPVRTRRTTSLYGDHSSQDDSDVIDEDTLSRLNEDTKEKSHSEELLSDQPITKRDFQRPVKHSKSHRMSYPIFKKTQSSPNLLNGISEECDSEGEESPHNSPRNSKRSLNRRRKFPPQRPGCRLSPIHSRRSSCSSSDDDEKLELRRGNFVNHLTSSMKSFTCGSNTRSSDTTPNREQSSQDGRKAMINPNPPTQSDSTKAASFSQILMKNREFPERILSDSNLMAYIANQSNIRYSLHRQKKCPSDTDLMNVYNNVKCLSLSTELNEKLTVVAAHRLQAATLPLSTRIEEENLCDMSPPSESPDRRDSDSWSAITRDGFDSTSCDSWSQSRVSSSDFDDINPDPRLDLNPQIDSNPNKQSTSRQSDYGINYCKIDYEQNNNFIYDYKSHCVGERRCQSDLPTRLLYLKHLASSLRPISVDGQCILV